MALSFLLPTFYYLQWPIDLADPFFRHQLVSRYSVG